MATLRGVLSAVAAILTALFGTALFVSFRGLSNSKAIGLAAVAGGLLESLFSPLFWILAILFFALFFAASRLTSRPLRILCSGLPLPLFQCWDCASSLFSPTCGYISEEGKAARSAMDAQRFRTATAHTQTNG